MDESKEHIVNLIRNLREFVVKYPNVIDVLTDEELYGVVSGKQTLGEIAYGSKKENLDEFCERLDINNQTVVCRNGKGEKMKLHVKDIIMFFMTRPEKKVCRTPEEEDELKALRQKLSGLHRAHMSNDDINRLNQLKSMLPYTNKDRG